MARYRLSAKPGNEWWLSWFKMVALILALIIFLSFAALRFGSVWRARFPHGPNLPLIFLFVAFGGALFLVAILLTLPRSLKNRAVYELNVTPDAVFLHQGSLRDQLLRREEVLGWIDHGRKGMMLPTADPGRLIAVPQDLEDYQGFRSELVAMGIGPIDPSTKRSLYGRFLLPTVILFGAMAFVFISRSPLLIVVAGVLMFAGMYESSRTSRQLYKKSSSLGLLHAGLLVVLSRLLSVVHHPPSVTPYISALQILLWVLVLGEWLYERRSQLKGESQ